MPILGSSGECGEAVSQLLEAMRGEVEGAFERVYRVLCVQPHPDDVDVAAGGTVAKLAARGVVIAYATLTDGRLGTFNPGVQPEVLALERKREQEEAAKVLGVRELYWLNFRDGELQPTVEARWELVKVIRKFRPDMVVAPDPWLSYEAHPDHRAAGILASEAAIFSLLPHAAPSPLAEGVEPHGVRYVAFYWTRKPNAFIDVSDFIEVKLRAVAAHKTQFGDSLAVAEMLKEFMKLVGGRVGTAYAEPFKVLTPFYLHCNVFAEDL